MAHEYPLSIVIQAVDKATAPLREINAELEKLREPVCSYCETCVVARPGEFCSPECRDLAVRQPPPFASIDDVMLELARG